ncbi:MAG TPA: hypothetical protein VFY12_03130, partial [Arenimonas sp.]|nr:hypothetical protein [Arenimonas sp.]
QALADQQRAASDVYYTDVAEQLLKREEPRAMLLAARLLRSTIDYRLGGPRQDEAAKALRARIAELVRAAALRAEGDEMVQWTLAGDAFRRELPDVAAAAIERLRQRDPDNLAVFFLGDSHGPWSSERVQLAAVTRRFELPFYDLMRSDLELLASFKMPASLLDAPNIQNLESIDGHQIMVFGLQMAESVPALLGLTRACRPGGEGWLPELRPSCERIASVLTHESNSLIGWSVGIALLEGLAETQEDRAAAEAARRTYRYQVEEGTLSQRTDEGQIAWLRAMREPGADEIAMLRQQLAARGLPETPPADWQPMTYEEQQAQWAADRAKRSE